MTRKLYLIRHTAVAVPPGICYGRSDVPLRESPALYAASLRSRLPAQVRIVSSPLSRCRLLAEAFGQVELDARFAEMDFGDWEGQAFSALPRDAIDAWAQAPLDFAMPGGESGARVIVRVLAALDELLARDEDAIIVSHGGPLRIIVGHLTGLPREEWLQTDMAVGALRVLTQRDTVWE